MKSFQDLPIQRKMLLMTLLICGVVLFVAIAALFIFQVLNFRSNFQRDTATLAAVVANNSTAALAFKDVKAAEEVVQSLKAKPSVLSACLVTANGDLLAQYGKENGPNELSQFPPPGQYRYLNGSFLYTQTVELDEKKLGRLYLRADYEQTFQALLGFYALLILGILIVSISLAVFLSDRLQRIITAPILQLAKTAQVVGERKDYSVRAPINRRGDELGRLAESFNEMLSRIQSQDAALSLSQQKMEAMIHSIDGIVWECDPDTFRFTFVSRQVERLLGYTAEAWMSNPRFWQEKLHPEDAKKVIETCHEMVARRRDYNHEYRMIAADGRTVWIRESGMVMVQDDRPVAVRGIFQDITEQKKSAEQLEQLNRKLVETSRHAGMAEVATGVLHNVGNVLNSVNVSASLLLDRFEKSQLQNLVKATDLLNDHAADPVAFLTQDPKGRRLPGYLTKLGAHLAVEQQFWQQELKELGRNIEHIKEIVAMQQSYARLSGVLETQDARQLLEDALRMNEAALKRHGVQVIRAFQTTPLLTVDKHKVLQILVNLIRNAKYALDASASSEKILTIVLQPDDQGYARIEVRDNGVGIAFENLTRIFQHGFTTKKNGHGFGLHSGANAAREMGGRLTAHSDGCGRGAVFTLLLPLATKKTMPAPDSVHAVETILHHEI